jgi:uncharacterized protein
MIYTAVWRRLDYPGHDSCRLKPSDGGAGWRLEGAAVFRAQSGPALLRYTVQLARDWTTQAGTVRGYVGNREIELRIERDLTGWRMNGRIQEAVRSTVDLDFQFTPATNLQQLRRLNLSVGQEAECPVAWLREDANDLVVLPQTYRRLDELRYEYRAPTLDYQATLLLTSSGFAQDYPTGWTMENDGQ